MAQVVEHSPSVLKALSSTPSTAKKKKEERKRDTHTHTHTHTHTPTRGHKEKNEIMSFARK
jgi:hypothetical protein